MREKILALAKTISNADATEGELLETLCQAAEARLERRLREGVTKEDCGAAFSCAAALLATADLRSSRCGGDTAASFTAGELSVREKAAAEIGDAVSELRATARRMMEPYAMDGGFAFCGVRG